MAGIFISYAQKENHVSVDDLERVLKSKGHTVFRDTGFLEYGDSQILTIKEEMGKADYVLVILSDISIKREWVIRELYEAVLLEQERRKKVLIPFIVGDLEYSSISAEQPLLSQWTKYDPYYFVRDPKCKDYEDLTDIFDRLSHMRFNKQNYSVLPIIKGGLDIYRTGDLVNFNKNEELKYVRTVDSYFLYGFQTGTFFKHFVSTQIRDIKTSRDLIDNCKYLKVTGDGDNGSSRGEWRLWFIDRNYGITTSEADPHCNNIEDTSAAQ